MSTLTGTVLVLLLAWCALGVSFWRKHNALRARRWVYEEADDRAYWEQLAEWWYGDDQAGLSAHRERVDLAVLVARVNDVLPRAMRRYRARSYALDGLRTWGNW